MEAAAESAWCGDAQGCKGSARTRACACHMPDRVRARFSRVRCGAHPSAANTRRCSRIVMRGAESQHDGGWGTRVREYARERGDGFVLSPCAPDRDAHLCVCVVIGASEHRAELPSSFSLVRPSSIFFFGTSFFCFFSAVGGVGGAKMVECGGERARSSHVV